jgi:ABC-type branched-subunit amino acid transport system substrate-binding protein
MKGGWVLKLALGVPLLLAGRPQGPAAAAQLWPPHYGNAPEAMVPFRQTEPFYRYFTSPQPFRGPGRDYPATPGLKTLRVGLLAPATNSPDSARGWMMRRAVELAIEEANATRRPGESPFELVVREDTPQWGSAANIMVDFDAVDHVLAVIGAVDSDATHVALRAALKLELFMVNTASSDPTITETNIPWILRVLPDDRQHGYALADLVVRQRGSRRIVVWRVNNRYGRMGVRTFVDSVRRLGVPVLLELRFRPGDRVFDTAVARIAEAQPDAILLWGDAEDAGRAAAALRAARVTAPLFGPDRLLEPAFLNAAGAAAEGATITFPFNPNRTERSWTDFVARFEKRFGARPDMFAAYGYDGARLLLEAIRRTGANRFRLRDALAALEHHEGVSGPLRFDPTLNNLAPLIVARVRQGRFHFDGPVKPPQR